MTVTISKPAIPKGGTKETLAISSGEYKEREEREKYEHRSKRNNITHWIEIGVLIIVVVTIIGIMLITLFHIVGPKSSHWIELDNLAILYQMFSFFGGAFVGHLIKPLIEGVFKKD